MNPPTATTLAAPVPPQLAALDAMGEATVRNLVMAAAAELIADQRCGCHQPGCPELRHAVPDAVVFTDQLLDTLDATGITLAHTTTETPR